MTDHRFDHLSPEERAVVGDPQDYDWEHPIEAPAPRREARSQFSMRIDPKLYSEIATIAEGRGAAFTDVVREALEIHVGRRRPAVGRSAFSVARATVFVTEDMQPWGSATRGSDAEVTMGVEPVFTG